MNRSDFKDWQLHPITKAFFKALEQKTQGLQIELGYSAGIDPRQDAIKVGAIQAHQDVLDADWFEETEV